MPGVVAIPNANSADGNRCLLRSTDLLYFLRRLAALVLLRPADVGDGVIRNNMAGVPTHSCRRTGRYRLSFDQKIKTNSATGSSSSTIEWVPTMKSHMKKIRLASIAVVTSALALLGSTAFAAEDKAMTMDRDKVDLNGDGMVSEDEIVIYVKMFFMKMDKDNDKMLSEREWNEGDTYD